MRRPNAEPLVFIVKILVAPLEPLMRKAHLETKAKFSILTMPLEKYFYLFLQNCIQFFIIKTFGILRLESLNLSVTF